MTQKQVIDAYKALTKLNTQPLPMKTAYALHKLRRALQPAWDFQVEQEGALFDKLKPTPIGNGALQFKSPDELKTWNQTIDELNAMPSDIEFAPVTVTMDDAISITPDDIDRLEGFVIFEEG